LKQVEKNNENRDARRKERPGGYRGESGVNGKEIDNFTYVDKKLLNMTEEIPGDKSLRRSNRNGG